MSLIINNEIKISTLNIRAYRKRVRSHWLNISVSLGMIAVTVILALVYPKIKCKDQLMFLINSLWPGGVIVAIVSVWNGVIHDLRKNIGVDYYELLEKELSLKLAGKSELWACLSDHRLELESPDKHKRKRALKKIIAQFNKSLQND